MSTAKTRIDSAAARDFLQQRFPGEPLEVQKVKGGEFAEAFFFELAESKYVLRINSDSTSFLKDMHAFAHFASPRLPIPEIIRHGRFDSGHFYAISERAPGLTQAELPLASRTAAIPSVVDTLEAIHGIDTSDTAGYGFWQPDGSATGGSLLPYVESCLEIADKATLFSKPYVDPDFHSALWKAARPLLQYLPQQRHLVHGDYGHDNLFVNEGAVSAVIDWGHSFYGDFMQDVAWLAFWDDEIDYGGLIRRHYDDIGKQVAYYDERLRLHKLVSASVSLGFYALADNVAIYEENLEWFKSMDLGL